MVQQECADEARCPKPTHRTAPISRVGPQKMPSHRPHRPRATDATANRSRTSAGDSKAGHRCCVRRLAGDDGVQTSLERPAAPSRCAGRRRSPAGSVFIATLAATGPGTPEIDGLRGGPADSRQSRSHTDRDQEHDVCQNAVKKRRCPAHDFLPCGSALRWELAGKRGVFPSPSAAQVKATTPNPSTRIDGGGANTSRMTILCIKHPLDD